MNAWDFLISPLGSELVHALIVLVNVITLAVVQRNRVHTRQVERRLDIYVGNLMRQIHGGHEHD